MLWTYPYTKFFYNSTVLKTLCNPTLTSTTAKLTNSAQIEITQKKIQLFHSSFSPQFQFLGFIDNLKDEETLQMLHGSVIKKGSIFDLGVGNYMLSLYVKFKDLSSAQKLFDEMSERDVRTWTILVSGFTRMRLFQLALDCFKLMLREGVCPNGYTLSSVFKCCSFAGLVRNGKAVHGWMMTRGVGLDSVLRNSILDFYVKCGELDYAKRLFQFTDDVDMVSWNIMIGAFMQRGDVESSLDLFRRLPVKDVATWNTIISGLMRNGSERTALELLYNMVKGQACLNEFTFTIALVLVSSLSILDLGVQIHGRLIRLGLYDNVYIQSSLIDMYSKCGVVAKALEVFKQEQSSKLMHDTVSWSSLVSGFSQNGRWEEAIEMLCKMVHEGIKVDKYILTTIVSVCADYGMLVFGQQIHALIHKSGHKMDLVLCSSLVDMYSKCGNLGDAQSMFDQSTTRNTVLWTALITGYALLGHGREAVRLFELMMEEGIQPNEVTFVAVLLACSHAGLVHEGRKYFKDMKEVYNVKTGLEHFTCMVDLLGRAGQLDEIKNFIYTNEISHLSSVWKAFLSSCRVHKNYVMGKWVSQKLLELEPLEAEPYVLLSNMCATSNRWEESATVRSLMQKKGVRKHPGQSWIQLNNQVHTFMIGDKSHPQEAEIYTYLDNLIGRLKEIGYSTEVGQVMQDVEEEQQEMFLRDHSGSLLLLMALL